jgi:hypothetical protein
MAINKSLWGIALTALGLGIIQAGDAHAAFITGPSDPNYNTAFQGASASTFATSFGFTVGTGPTNLKVSTGTWTDPSGFFLGTVHALNGSLSGTTTDKLTYGYTTTSPSAASANARDYDWLQNNPGPITTNPDLDTPWLGTIWDLGGQANQAVVFPIVDHGPLPEEALEYTVYLTNNPASTSLADWSLATLDAVYLQGWEVDATALADGFTTVWKLPGNQTFRYVSVRSVGSQALGSPYGDEDEIDAVGGLTAQGQGLLPEPTTLLLMLTGIGVLGAKRRIA